MIIIKAGGHPTGHRSCMQSSCSGISGFFPYQGPATQVFPHHRTHPVGFLRLCLSDETQRLEQSFEGTGPGVCAGGSTSLTEASATHTLRKITTSPLPFPSPSSAKESRRIEQAFRQKQPWAQLLSPRIVWLHQIGVWGLFLVFTF